MGVAGLARAQLELVPTLLHEPTRVVEPQFHQQAPRFVAGCPAPRQRLRGLHLTLLLPQRETISGSKGRACTDPAAGFHLDAHEAPVEPQHEVELGVVRAHTLAEQLGTERTQPLQRHRFAAPPEVRLAKARRARAGEPPQRVREPVRQPASSGSTSWIA